MTDATQTPSRDPARDAKMSTLAVTAFVLSLVPCSALLGIILGVVALLRIKKSEGAARGRGFALAAIIIPLVALPITAAFAVPAYKRYECGAAQSEARFVLRALHAAQEGYRLEHNRYANDVTELAFAPGGDAHYSIRILEARADGYRAEAISGEDVWLVDERGTPENTQNACD